MPRPRQFLHSDEVEDENGLWSLIRSKGKGGLKRSKPKAGNRANEKTSVLEPALYVVATPIGNLADITLRALEVLANVDVIACEDTRVTAKLLAHYGIRTPTTRFDDHNASQARPRLLERMTNGQLVSLVSDAGTPLISDPGYSLVQAAAEAKIAIIPVPGPSSVLAALSVAGLPTDRFLFAGFLPPKQSARIKELAGLASFQATLVFLESPRRLGSTLADMARVFGSRPVTVSRELTKKFEEIRRGTLEDLALHYAKTGAPKGELVLLVGGAAAAPVMTEEEVLELLSAAMATNSLRQAVKDVTVRTSLPRRTVYALALKLAAK